MNSTTLISTTSRAIAALLEAALFVCPLGLSGQTVVPNGNAITSERPVLDAATLLRNLYAAVVTYEEPLPVFPDDLAPNRRLATTAKWALTPKQQTFVLPPAFGVEPNVAAVLDQTLSAYHQQMQSGVRFKVQTSTLGYHIVPSQVRDANGAWVPASSILDARISVPVEERTPLKHLEALIASLRSAVGVRVIENLGAGSARGWNALFRPQTPQFSWGGDYATARDAVIDLFQRSATTYLWEVRCQPSARQQDTFCSFNWLRLAISTRDAAGNPVLRGVSFDRCKSNCPPKLPPPVGPQPLKQPNR